MADDLRGPLVEQIERMAADLLVGRHGDPYVAFAILVHPDRPPTILTILPDRPPIDLTRLVRGDGDGTPFPVAEFDEASRALDDARLGLMLIRHDRSGMQPGAVIAQYMLDHWDRRRMAPVEHALRVAEHEAAHPAVCGTCKRRFTERGLKMHLARNHRCGQKAPVAGSAKPCGPEEEE